MDITLTDPTWTPKESSSKPLALRFILDERDTPFLRLMFLLTLVMVPSAVYLYVDFNWYVALPRLVLVYWFLGPYILMLHNTSHRRLFKAPWSRLNHYIPWVLGPFFGESPESYFTHHVGMHHPENNLEDDVSSTLPYRRDSVWGFTRYFLRFFFGVIFELPIYFMKKKRARLAIRGVGGELLFFIMVGGLSYVSFKATLFVFIIPYLSTRLLMMCGNWGQHAFVDKDSPECEYRNSITCINTTYNRRCFNDGYHIGHHIKQTRHWTEMPEDFQKNIDTYAKERAIVFQGIDFFMVWVCLMLKRYDWLARKYVKLPGGPQTEEEIITLLKSRTQWSR